MSELCRLFDVSSSFLGFKSIMLDRLQDFVNKLNEELYDDDIHHRVWDIPPMSHCLEECSLDKVRILDGRTDFHFSFSTPYEDHVDYFEYNIPHHWEDLSILEIAEEIREKSLRVFLSEAEDMVDKSERNLIYYKEVVKNILLEKDANKGSPDE